ncbi:CD63 antigen [Camponotus floridanus]|uniref:Tetraspanin n=1 Tax=Camponotus floridanus TaxID=104421 RepID=E2B224_CAMFO|nr:CD63 antigen [Camponotus floridanus]
MESCGMNVIKYILFIFNLVFAISGIGIIAAGACVLADVGEFSHFVEGRIIAPPVVLIVAGAIVFVIAFLGCYGAIKEHYHLLIAFAAALLIIFVIEFAVGIAAAVFKNDFSMAMKDTLKESMKNYTEADKMAWDNVQKKLQCCGVDGPNDWSPANGFMSNFPSSCCIQDDQLINCRLDNVAYREGCFSKLEMRVHKGATVLIGVGIGIAFVEASKLFVLLILQDILIKCVKSISCQNLPRSY